MYFKPSYLPSNGAANILVRSLAEELGLLLNKKYEIILASFLAVAKKVDGQAFDWCTGTDNKNLKFWSLFPNVSSKSVSEVYKLLKDYGYIGTTVDVKASVIDSYGFEKSNWIKAQRLPKYFMEEAAFIESNLPLVLVKKPEAHYWGARATIQQLNMRWKFRKKKTESHHY